MALSNAEKMQHGKSAQTSLEHILEYCQTQGFISKIIPDYRIGKVGYSNTKQFYAPFVIEFSDNTKWALFTTTSMRTDRIKGQQWDAFNLRTIEPTIEHVFLIYPDGIPKDELRKFINQNKKYQNKEEFSAIDAIVSQDQISNLIESYALRSLSVGQKKDKEGTNFEIRIANLLNYPGNLQKWKTNSNIIEGMHYDAFKKIIDCFGLDKYKTKKIFATADKKSIRKLPSGGNPKTDVIVCVTLNDDTVLPYTISCKRSSDQSVSVHQYTANSFLKVLDPDNKLLGELLCDFQMAGSMSALGEEKCLLLKDALTPYLEKLTLWVLGGHNGDGNPQLQWANYILTYDNNEGDISIHTLQDYCSLLLSAPPANFGTPFSWTYPSKRRGQSIQLKCKIIK